VRTEQKSEKTGIGKEKTGLNRLDRKNRSGRDRGDILLRKKPCIKLALEESNRQMELPEALKTQGIEWGQKIIRDYRGKKKWVGKVLQKRDRPGLSSLGWFNRLSRARHTAEDPREGTNLVCS